VDDDGAADEIDAGAAGFEAAEKDAARRIAVETVDDLAAVDGGAVSVT
jgi:hypothetical protein